MSKPCASAPWRDASVDLRTSRHVAWEATSSRPQPPIRLANGGDRAQDHARSDLWLRDHDHVGAFNLGDCCPGAACPGTDDIADGRLVTGSNDRPGRHPGRLGERDRKSTRLNSSHANISYAVFCLKKNKH